MPDFLRRNEGRIVATRIHAYAPERLPPFGSPELLQLWKIATDHGIAVQLNFEPPYAPRFEVYLNEFRDTPVIIDHLGRPLQGTPEEHAVVIRWSERPLTIMKIVAFSEETEYPTEKSAR